MSKLICVETFRETTKTIVTKLDTSSHIVNVDHLFNSHQGLRVENVEKSQREKEVAEHGLGVITAAVFLAGEMAGSGVLAIPSAMVGTGNNFLKKLREITSYRLYFLGWAGVALITLFCMNAAFSGTRLGLCWVMLEERYEEFRREIRDPYPSIGEKAVGRWGR